MTNFPEGTRFSPEKRDKWKSPYRNLLQPRIGGLGQVLYALADQLDALIDVTIIYPQTTATGLTPTFWQLLTGEIPEIIVKGQTAGYPSPIAWKELQDRSRGSVVNWRPGWDQLWRNKDDLISTALDHESPSQHSGDQSKANAK